MFVLVLSGLWNALPARADTADYVVINEVQITGGTGRTSDDFIRLYNPTSEIFNLKGHRLVKKSGTRKA